MNSKSIYKHIFVFLLCASIPLIVLAKAKQGRAEPQSNTFLDIAEDSLFYIPVSYLKEHNLISGYSDNRFYPDRSVSRAEALAMIVKATGSMKNSDKSTNAKTLSIAKDSDVKITLPRKTKIKIQHAATGEEYYLEDIRTLHLEAIDGNSQISFNSIQEEKPFRDVNPSAWYYDIAQNAKIRGTISGEGNGQYFEPDKPVTLAACLRMLFKDAGINTELSKSEVPKGLDPKAWYAHDIAYALSKTIMTQKDTGVFMDPNHELTRGELAVILYRFMRTKEGIEFGYASWYGDGLAKTNITHGQELKEKNLTAAHKIFPMGTIVRVTNFVNGKKVDVVINDRGPFVVGRVVDLSKTAFSNLESTTMGIVPVMVEKLEEN